MAQSAVQTKWTALVQHQETPAVDQERMVSLKTLASQGPAAAAARHSAD
jgi:hypothetical protein